MAFAPEEIQSKEFFTTLRGYDKDEVRAFLSALAEEHQQLLQRVQSPPASSEAGYESLGRGVESVLEAANRAGEDIRREARHETERLATQQREAAAQQVREAERQATEMREAAAIEVAEAARRVQGLQQVDATLRHRLTTVQSELRSLIEQMGDVEQPRGAEEAAQGSAQASGESDETKPAPRAPGVSPMVPQAQIAPAQTEAPAEAKSWSTPEPAFEPNGKQPAFRSWGGNDGSTG